MSNVPLIDISEYLQKLLLVKASHELEPVRQLVLDYEDILKLYPLIKQQMQEYLVPKLHVDYTALALKISKELLELKKFHIQHQKIHQDSERWGTLPDWEAIQAKVALFYLPYDDLNTLKINNSQREQDEEERQRVNKQKKKQAEKHRRDLVILFANICIFTFFGLIVIIPTCAPKAPVAIVSATPPSPIVVDNKIKKKNKEKKEDRVPLEDYLKGIENACDFSKAPKKLLSLTLEPVKKFYGPLETDFSYVYPRPINKNIVKENPDLYKSVPKVKDKGGYSEASVKINGVFHGLAASELIEGVGHENGIGFFTIVFDSPNAEAVLSKKLKFTTIFLEISRSDHGAFFTVKNGKTHMTCDWSD